MSPGKRLTREEEAHRDIGHTDITPHTALLLTVVFFVTISAVPLIQFAIDLSAGKLSVPTNVMQLLPFKVADESTAFHLPSPGEIKAVETDIEDSSFLNAILPVVQDGLSMLGIGNEQVIIGTDEWLYYAKSVEHVTGPGFLEHRVLEKRRRDATTDTFQPNPLLAIDHFKQELAEHGIELIVVPVPAKPSIHPEGLSARSAPLHNSSWDEFIDQLVRAGVRVFDPTEVLIQQRESGEAYLKRDTHWRPAAMQAVAEAVAKTVSDVTPVKEVGPKKRMRQKTVSAVGDLDVMVKQTSPPGKESVLIQRVMDEESYTEASVILLGDSFSNIYSAEQMGWGTNAGFGEHLAAELGVSVKVIVRNDNGAWQPRAALVRAMEQGEISLQNCKAVVWQFATRELSFGDWRIIDLPRDSEKQPSAEEFNFDEGMIVDAQIVNLSRPPQPASTPYPDAIIAIHIEVLKDESGLPKELLAYTWGMQGHRWLPAARLRAGQKIQGKIVAWSTVREKFESLPRIELDNIGVLSLPIFWLEAEDASTSKEERIAQTPKAGNSAIHTLASFLEKGSPPQPVVVGSEGWLLLPSELRFLARLEVEANREPSKSKPLVYPALPTIIDFKNQLATENVRLVIAPVPPKALAHSEALQKLDVNGEALLAEYRSLIQSFNDAGVTTYDLTEPLLSLASKGTSAFCWQDSHWSPSGIRAVAEYLASRLPLHEQSAAESRGRYTVREVTSEIVGDLWRMLPEPRPERESLTMYNISKMRGGLPSVLDPADSGRVLLLGDSNTLVFSEGGDMHSRGGGLAEWLMFLLDEPVARVGVRGSGSLAARVSLARRPEILEEAELVVWVFAARDFTERSGGWKKLDITP